MSGLGDQSFFYVGAVFLVVTTLAMIRLGWGAGGWHWAAGWCCLWASGAAALLSRSMPAFTIALPILGTAFAALSLSGAFVFSGRRVPRWLVPTAVTIGLSRATLTPVVDYGVTQAMGAAVITLCTIGAAGLSVTPQRSPRQIWDVVLCIAFCAMTVAATTFAYLVSTDTSAGQAFFIWLVVGVMAAGIQVVALMGRMVYRSETQRTIFASVLDAVPVGLALIRHDGRLDATNSTFQKIAVPGAHAPDTLDLSTVVDSLHGQLEAADGDLLHESLSKPAGRSSQELRFRNGLRVLSSMHLVPEARGNGTLGRLWQLMDVTEERRLREDLERARRLETLGGFAGGVAHDFNNQLTSVLGNTALLRDAVVGDEATNEILSDLEASAQYCASLTNDVLDFARQGPGARVPLRLDEILPGILKRYGNANPQTELLIAPGTPRIMADTTSVERVVCNLVENALHAVGPDGLVTVRAARSSHDRVTIEVHDDGPGMDERVRARIFDPFFTTKEVGKGTGLGLAIVYGIVSSQGGEARAESRPGHGTRMITTWPVAAGDWPDETDPDHAPA